MTFKPDDNLPYCSLFLPQPVSCPIDDNKPFWFSGLFIKLAGVADIHRLIPTSMN